MNVIVKASLNLLKIFTAKSVLGIVPDNGTHNVLNNFKTPAGHWASPS